MENKKLEDMTVTELKAVAFDMNNQLQAGINQRNAVLELIQKKLEVSDEVVPEETNNA
jgi:hypothetical protein